MAELANLLYLLYLYTMVELAVSIVLLYYYTMAEIQSGDHRILFNTTVNCVHRTFDKEDHQKIQRECDHDLKFSRPISL